MSKKARGILLRDKEGKKELLELMIKYNADVNEEDVEKSDEFIVTVSIIHKTLI